MQESLVIIGIVQTIAGLVVLPILLYLLFQHEMKPFRRISEIATSIFDGFDDSQKEKVSVLLDTLSPIAEAAGRINGILTNEAEVDGWLTSFANKFRKSFVAGLLGEASGDSKRMVKAEKIVNAGIIDMLGEVSPWLPIAADKLGLKEWMDEDPKMFDAIVATVFQKGGLINMFKAQNPDMLKGLGDSGSLATPDKSERGEY